MWFKVLVGFSFSAAMLVSFEAVAATVETTNFISSPTNFNGFENVGPVSNQFGIYQSPYTEGGIKVEYVGTLGVQPPSLDSGILSTALGVPLAADGNFLWLPNGGGNGATRITLVDGGSFQEVQFLTGSGFNDPQNRFGGFTEYELLKNGVVVATGKSPNTNPMTFLGFSGGGFDTILVQDLVTPGDFDPNGIEDLALDSIAAVEAATPLPATLPLFAAGLGVLSLLGWYRKKKAALAA